MIKKTLAALLLGTSLILGENAMADTSLNAKQKSIATAASYAARGNQAGLKQALIDGLNAGVTVNEFKEIMVQVYAYCGFPRSLNTLNTLMQVEEERGNADEQGKLPNASRTVTALISARPIRLSLSASPYRKNCLNLRRRLTNF